MASCMHQKYISLVDSVCMSVPQEHCYIYAICSRINYKTDQEGIEGVIEMDGLEREILKRYGVEGLILCLSLT
jgi:hypothetical protein